MGINAVGLYLRIEYKTSKCKKNKEKKKTRRILENKLEWFL